MEVLGCGVMEQELLNSGQITHTHTKIHTAFCPLVLIHVLLIRTS